MIVINKYTYNPFRPREYFSLSQTHFPHYRSEDNRTPLVSSRATDTHEAATIIQRWQKNCLRFVVASASENLKALKCLNPVIRHELFLVRSSTTNNIMSAAISYMVSWVTLNLLFRRHFFVYLFPSAKLCFHNKRGLLLWEGTLFVHIIVISDFMCFSSCYLAAYSMFILFFCLASVCNAEWIITRGCRGREVYSSDHNRIHEVPADTHCFSQPLIDCCTQSSRDECFEALWTWNYIPAILMSGHTALFSKSFVSAAIRALNK